MTSNITISPIGTVRSPYKEKFAIPRQPGLINSARGIITLEGDCNCEAITTGLSQFSHLWLVFVFHQTAVQGWKPMIRPPRLGGNQKVGVFASRSTFRPNPIGMSVVKLERVFKDQEQVCIEVSGIDLLDGTPIIDIKPYLPYADSIQNAEAGFAQQAPSKTLTVNFSEQALATISHESSSANIPDLQSFIHDVLAQDPRPAYKHNKPDDKEYGVVLYHLNINWRMLSMDSLLVTKVAIAKS